MACDGGCVVAVALFEPTKNVATFGKACVSSAATLSQQSTRRKQIKR